MPRFLHDTLFALIVIFSLVMAIGCIDDVESPEFNSTSVEIIGGTQVTGHAGLVAINRTCSTCGCTGWMLSDTVIVTAAHCVSDPPGTAPFLIEYFDPVAGRTTVWNNNLDYARHPNYDETAPKCGNHNDDCRASHDIGYLHNTSGTWAQTAYLDYLRVFNDGGGLLGTIRMWGQGWESESGTSGTLRHALFEVNTYINNIIETLGTSTQAVCAGDSGGPVLKEVNGMELVAGVNSSSEKLSQQNECSYDGGRQWETRTNADHITWILSETGEQCTDLYAHGLNYKRCFDIPFIEDIDEEGLPLETATAIAVSFL